MLKNKDAHTIHPSIFYTCLIQFRVIGSPKSEVYLKGRGQATVNPQSKAMTGICCTCCCSVFTLNALSGSELVNE